MIRISDTYFIDSDKNNIILVEKVVLTEEKYNKLSDKLKENAVIGSEKFNEIGYYSDIPSAIENLFERKCKKLVKDKEFKDYKEVVQAMRNIKNELSNEIVDLKSILR